MASTRTPVTWKPVFSLVSVALLTCVVAVAAAHTAAPAPVGLLDPGALVRWGLPVTRVVHDLAAALMIGLLVLAATAVPDDKSLPRVRAALRLATMAGGVWVAAGLVGVVLGFSSISGTPVTNPDFGAQLQTFVWSLEPLRAQIVSTAVALVATSFAAIATTRPGTALAGALALLALLPLALAGHASGSADHETSVNALAVHLLAATIWVGGLAALTLLRPRLHPHLPVVVRRYSTIALVCFVALGLSGLLSAWLRIGSFGALATSYGAILLVKVGAFVLLGTAGWAQRRRVVAALGRTPESGRLFARLVAVELVLMGIGVGAAVALSRTATPVPDAPTGERTVVESLTGFAAPPAPNGTSWITEWRWDWLWGSVAIGAVVLYLVGAHRLRARGDEWSPARTVNWTVGWVLFVWATCGAPGVYGRVAFSWHMIEHMVVAMTVPILLVLGAPFTLALRVLKPRQDHTLGPRELLTGLTRSKYLHVVANPVVAAVVFFVSLLIFYFTPIFSLALTSHAGHVLMVVHFLMSGYLFAWVLIGVDPGPRRWAPSMLLLILFATISFHAFFGVALTTGTTLLAPDFFGVLDLSWVPDPLADQQWGGAIAWGVGELPTLLLAMLVTLAWVRTDDAEAKRLDRKAARDGDADLVAYNARLHQLAEWDASHDAQRRPRAPRAPRTDDHARSGPQ